MKPKYLVFGDGLLGSTLGRELPRCVVLSKEQCDITDKDQVSHTLKEYSPEIVINAAGIVPKYPSNAEYMFQVNSFAPQFLAEICHKLVHISTDCVFSGARGKYTERDKPDAQDMYGMSKALGEPERALVIRTSFVGLPDPKGRGLLHWAAEQKEIVGYDCYMWNGTTTVELAKKIDELVTHYRYGIRHVYSYTLSKFELLRIANDVFGWDATIHSESSCTVENKHITDKTLASVYANGFITTPTAVQLRNLLE